MFQLISYEVVDLIPHIFSSCSCWLQDTKKSDTQTHTDRQTDKTAGM